MADTLNVYKGANIVSSADYVDGKATVSIDGLEANTDYAVGTYQVSRKNENGESSKVDVPAFKTKPIVVTGVKLDQTALTIDVGSTATLVATVSPTTATDKSTTYASSDEAVATVDNKGVVTAISAGTTDITVTTTDGSKTAVATVTVSEVTPEEPADVNVTPNETDADVSAQ
ncbi:phage tail protein [Staphylococcus succinus]|nr:phage tail protein [Staphylococcus succinus]